jgi:hypothetical protein
MIWKRDISGHKQQVFNGFYTQARLQKKFCANRGAKVTEPLPFPKPAAFPVFGLFSGKEAKNGSLLRLKWLDKSPNQHLFVLSA